MQVREATARDIPAIQVIAHETWQATYPGIISNEQIEYMLERTNTPAALKTQMEGGHTFLLAGSSDAPAAFAAFSFPEDAVCKIWKLYIHPNYQRKGLGVALIGAIANSAKGKGCAWLELNVNRSNPAYYFYLKQGFSVAREADIPFGPFTLNDYVMQRRIE